MEEADCCQMAELVCAMFQTEKPTTTTTTTATKNLNKVMVESANAIGLRIESTTVRVRRDESYTKYTQLFSDVGSF